MTPAKSARLARGYYTQAEAAEYLGLPKGTFGGLVWRGCVEPPKARHSGSTRRYYREADLKRLKEQVSMSE